ncbi:MAG: RNA polymerase sigma factor [Gaiellaceae bacterium]
MSATYAGRRESTAVAEDAAATTRALYERYGQRVLSFCLSRLRDSNEAQDATQTTFLYALRALDNGVEPRSELAWLLTIAHNTCRSIRRSLNRRDARTSYADVTELEAAAESISADTGEELAWLREALERLPENQRRAILLREWQGLSYADIAAELRITIAAVETLLFRARRGLASQLERSRGALRALDLGSLGLLLGSLRKGGAAKATVAGMGLTMALAPVTALELSAKGEPQSARPDARHLTTGPGGSTAAHTSSVLAPRRDPRKRALAGSGLAVRNGARGTSVVSGAPQSVSAPPSQPSPAHSLPSIPPLPAGNLGQEVVRSTPVSPSPPDHVLPELPPLPPSSTPGGLPPLP